MISDNTITELIADSDLTELLKKTAETASRSGYLPPNPTCGECKYSEPYTHSNKALCRVNPPVMGKYKFPTVDANLDWCSYFVEVNHAE